MVSLLDAHNIMLKRDQQVLCENLSLQILPGQCWGILGLNGRGKTTLLHTLAGLLSPSTGEIYSVGKRLDTWSRKVIATQIGLLLQEEHALFSTLVWDMVMSGRYARRTSIDSTQIHGVLEQLQLSKLAYKDVLKLSGGERRRVSIARILFQNPGVFLLDEPTHQLDPLWQQRVMDCFKVLCVQANRAVVFSCHDVNLVELYCDHVVLFLEDGMVLAGRKEELLTLSNLQAIYGCAWSAFEGPQKIYIPCAPPDPHPNPLPQAVEGVNC